MTLALLLLALAPPLAVVEDVELNLKDAPQQERDRLGDVLLRFVDAPVGNATTTEAEKALMRLGPFASALCKIDNERVLVCSLSFGRVIRRVEFQGLPPQLLESDLRRRVFLRPGEALSPTGDEARVERQRRRLEEYLKREGLLGAKVKIETRRLDSRGAVVVVVRVTGGAFVRVRQVELTNASPLEDPMITDRFRGMCARSDAIVRAFETGFLACFTRDRTRATIEDLERTLVDAGYPEARVSVRPHLVPPDASEACGDPEATVEERKNLDPTCVDLEVTVDSGPLLRAILSIERPDGEIVREPPYDPVRDLFLAPVRTISRVTEFAVRPLEVLAETPLSDTADAALDLSILKQSLTFKDARAADESEAEVGRQALLRTLARRGYLRAEVELDYRLVPGVLAEARYRVKTGHAYAIRSVDIVGNFSFTDEELKSAVDLSAAPRSTWRDGFVAAVDLEADVSRIENLYVSRGFSEASVTVGMRTDPPEGDRRFVDVVFRVSEGQRYIVAGVELKGGDTRLTPAVLKVLEHCGGANPKRADECEPTPLKAELLDTGDAAGAEAQRVASVYAANGYPLVRARVELSPIWTDDGPLVRVEVWQEGQPRDAPPKRATLGRVFVSGAARTGRAPLLQDMGIEEVDLGHALDPVAIAEGVSRLRRTGLFARVRHRFIAARETDRVVDLLIDVEERPSVTADASVAVSTDNLVSLRADFRDRNVAGVMLDFTSFLDLGLFIGRRSEAGVELKWPRIRGLNLDVNLKGFARYTDNPTASLLNKPPIEGPTVARSAYATDAVRDRIFIGGGAIGVEGKPLANQQTLRVGIDYELSWTWSQIRADRIEAFTGESFTTLDGLLLIWDGDQVRTGQIAPYLRYSSVKNPFDPKSGVTFDTTLRFGAPVLGGNETFFLGTVTSTGYYPLGDRFVLAGQFRAWLGGTQLEPGVKTSVLTNARDLIQLGGDRSVRGYNRQGEGTLFGLNELTNEVATGQRTSFSYVGGIVNGELRATVARDVFLGDLVVAGFFDAGFVTDRNLDAIPDFPTLLELNQVGASVGVGLRYVLPVGPISFDFGRSITSDNAAFHLQFGHAF